jgi:hypothetical protein
MDACMYVCVREQKCGQLGKATGYLIRGTLSLLRARRSLTRLYLNESVLPLVVLIDIQNRASAILLHA